MNTYEIQTPSGDVLTIEAVDEATAIAGAQQWFESQGKNKPTLDNPPPSQTEDRSRIGGSLVRGWNSLQDSGYLAAADAGLISPETAAAAVAQNAQDAAAFPAPPSVAQTRARAAQEWEKGNYGSAALEYVKNPMDTLSMAGESAAPSAVGLGAAVAGGAVSGGLGFAAGMGAGSGVTEYGSSVKEFLQKKGVDLANPQQLQSALADPALMEEARTYAAKRGAMVGAFDAISGGAAGKLFSPIAKSLGGGAVGKVAGAVAETGAQASLGAAGEAGAQIATEGRVNNPMAVLEEGILEGVTGVGDIALAPRQQLAQPAQATDPATVQQSAAETAPTVETPKTAVEEPQAAVLPPPPELEMAVGKGIIDELKDEPKIAGAVQQYVDFATKRQPSQDVFDEKLAGVAGGLQAVQEMVPDEAQRPTYDMRESMNDGTVDKEGNPNAVYGAYDPASQNVEISLSGTSAGIMGNFVHETVHHLDNLGKNTEWGRASSQVFDRAVINVRRGKDLYTALPRSVRTQMGPVGESFLRGISLPEGEVNRGEIKSYAIQARRLDRVEGTTPSKKNFIGRGLDWAVEFVERSANALAGRGFKSAQDYVGFIESGQFSQYLAKQGIQSQTSRPVQSPALPQQPVAAAAQPSSGSPSVEPPAPSAGGTPQQTQPVDQQTIDAAARSDARQKMIAGAQLPAPIPPASQSPRVQPSVETKGGTASVSSGTAPQASTPAPSPQPVFSAQDQAQPASDANLYQKAVRLTREKGYGSAGYLTAALKTPREQTLSMLQKMEQEGVVGPADKVTGKRPILAQQASASPQAAPASAAPETVAPTAPPSPVVEKASAKAKKAKPPQKPATVEDAIAKIPADQKIPATNVYPFLPKEPSGTPDYTFLRKATEAVIGEPVVWGKLEPAQQRDVLKALQDPQRQFSRASSPNNPEFREWFKGSKAVEKSGQPKRYYHGTNKNFDTFGGARSGALEGKEGPFYFSPEPTVSNAYTEIDPTGLTDERQRDGGRVIPVFLSAKNVFDAENMSSRELDAVLERADEIKPLTRQQAIGVEKGDFAATELPQVQQAIREAGYDGFHVYEMGVKNLAVYTPEQVKSVFNEFKEGTATSKQFSRASQLTGQSIDEFKQWWGDSKVVDADGNPKVVYHGGTGTFDQFRMPTYFTEDAGEASAYTFSGALAKREKLLSKPKYKAAQAPKAAVGKRLPYTGVFSDIPSDAIGEMYATDQGVGARNSDGTITFYTNLIAKENTYDGADGGTVVASYGNNNKKYQKLAREMREYVDRQFPKGEGDGGNVKPVYLSIQNPKRMDAYEANRFGARLGGTPQQWEAAVAELERDGYDGIVTESDDTAFLFSKEKRSQQWIPLRPEQIKSVYNEFKEGTATSKQFSRARGDEPYSTMVLMRNSDGKKRTLTEAANYLRSLFVKHNGDTNFSERTPENQRKIIDHMYREAKAALAESKTAVGWYDDKLKESKRILALIEPQILTDPDAEAIMDLATAVTSNGLAVKDNYVYALRQYRAFKNTGRFLEEGWGDQGKPMKKAFEFANEMVDKLGVEAFTRFLNTEFTVSELKKMGFKVSTGENASTKVFGSYVFGPKIGQGFYQNLRGNYDPLTMDRWFMRMWNRIIGDPFEKPTAPEPRREKIIDMIRNGVSDVDREILDQAKGGILPEGMTVEDAAARADVNGEDMAMFDAYAISVDRAFQRYYTQTKKAGGTPVKSKLMSLFGTHAGQQSEILQEQPRGAKERIWIRETVSKVVDKLRKDGININVADFQAVVWYPEKSLWESLGVKRGKGENNDYSDAAAYVAEQEGISAQAIEAARANAGGRGVAAGPNVTSGNAGGRGSNSPPYGRPIEGFEREELLRNRTIDGRQFSRATAQELAVVNKIQAPMGGKNRFSDVLSDSQGRIVDYVITKMADKHWWAEAAERRKSTTNGKMREGALKDAAFSPRKRLAIADNAPSIAAGAIIYGAPELRDGGYVMKDSYDKENGGNAKALNDIIKSAYDKGGNEGIAMWTTWMAAKRAAALMNKGKEKLFSAMDIAIFSNLHNDPRYDWFEDHQKMWDDYNNDILQFAVDTGYMTAAQKTLWQQSADYIPFYRIIDENVAGPTSGSLARLGAASKNLKGGKAQLANLLENMTRNTEALVRKSVQHHAMTAVVKEFGDPQYGLLTKVPISEASLARLPIKNIKRAMIQRLQQTHPNDAVEYESYIEMLPDNPEFYDIMGIQQNKDPDVIMVRNPAGEMEAYRVNDKLALESLTWLPPKQGALVRALMLPKEWLTKSITATPPYMLFNLFRDSIAAPFFGGGFKPVIGTLKGLTASAMQSTAYKNLIIGGGSPIGGFYAQSHMRQYKDITASKSNPLVVTSKNAWAVVQRMGEAVENANRMAIRQGALDKGMSIAEANYQAYDLAGFSAGGASSAARFITSTVPFWNAAIQSLYKLGRQGYLKGGRARLYLMGAMLAGATLALEMHNEDDERYKKLSNVDKALYYHIYLDRLIPKEALKAAGFDKFTEEYKLVIPKPFEVGHAFSTVPSAMYRYFTGQDKSKDMVETAKFIFGNVFKLNPVELLPTPVKAFTEQYMNYDVFRDRPIVPSSVETPNNRKLEYNYNTPQIIKDIGAATGMSPLRVQKAIRDFTGNVGDMAVTFAEMTYRKAIGMPATVKLDNREDPLLNATGVARMFPRSDPVFTKAEKEFTELAEEVSGFNRAVNRLKIEDPKALQQYVKDNPATAAMARIVPDIQRDLSKIRKAKISYYYSSDPAARDKIIALERQEAQITQNFLEQYYKIEKRYGK